MYVKPPLFCVVVMYVIRTVALHGVSIHNVAVEYDLFVQSKVNLFSQINSF